MNCQKTPKKHDNKNKKWKNNNAKIKNGKEVYLNIYLNKFFIASYILEVAVIQVFLNRKIKEWP